MRAVGLTVLAFLVLLVAPTGEGVLQAATWPPKYVALGDSLALSIQPDVHGVDHPTTQGYAEAVWHAQAASLPQLQLAKLGRGGETAASMITPRKPGPSQLHLAEDQLRDGGVTLVTIDIGANEVESCARGDHFDSACVKRGLASLRASLPRIVGRLRAAGGKDLRIVGINYYNSFLGRWVRGAAGRRLARASMPVERAINQTLSDVYGRLKVPVADVEDRFATDQINQFTRTASYGRVPLAVARTCRWTWACSARYDDHTNALGYRVIARAVLALLRSGA